MVQLSNFIDSGVGGLVAQSCLTLCDPTNCSPSDSSIRGILQARALEQAAISFSIREITKVYNTFFIFIT